MIDSGAEGDLIAISDVAQPKLDGESLDIHVSPEAIPVPIGGLFTTYDSAFSSGGERGLEFYYEGRLDLTGFNQGSEFFVPILDLRKPPQFSYTNRGMYEQLADTAYVDQLIARTRNPLARFYLEELRATRTIRPVDSAAIGSHGYHGGSLFFTTPLRELFSRPLDKIERMRRKGLYGRNDGVTYFSVNLDEALNHGKSLASSPQDPNRRLLLLTLNILELAKRRNIFIDPESLVIQNEFMKHFVVHRGIPVSAIESADVLQFRGIRKKAA